jgi:hypothetical protein
MGQPGTLAVLEFAALKGHVDFPLCVEQLRASSLRMPKEIVARMLRDDAARKLK